MTRKQWLIRLALCFALFWLAATSALAEERFGVTGTDGVKLRQGPSASAGTIAEYPAGVWLSVTGETGGWYAVTSPDGSTGYVGQNQLLWPSAPVVSVGVVANLKDNAYVNLRQSPHYQADVLATYHNGVPCLLLSHTNGWYHVRVEGVEGYLREEYVQAQVMAWSEDTATVIAQSGISVSLQAGPGAQYASLGMYPNGQYVMVIQSGLAWCYVSVNGQTGYIDATCLRSGVLSLSEISLAEWDVLSNAYAIVSNPVNTQLLNLRESPSTVARVLGQYRTGTRLTLLNQGLEWCRVMNDAGEIGYMMTNYLTLEGVPETPVMTVNHPDETFVNLRSVPSTVLGAVLAQVPHGLEVTVLIPGSEWVKVQYGEMVGYMVAWFLAE